MDDTQGDERGADVLAVGERGKALDMDPEQARERVGLGVTELRELGRDVLHRAMPLAQLHTGQGRALSDRSGGGGESIRDQCSGKCVRAHSDVIAGSGQLCRIASFEVRAALAGELAHRVRAGVVSKKPQRRCGDVVVVTAHTGVTCRGKDVCAGGPATAANCATRSGRLTLLDRPLLGEGVEVTADSSRCQAQKCGHGARGERAMLGDRRPYLVPGARIQNLRSGVGPVRTFGSLLVGDKHNSSVT